MFVVFEGIDGSGKTAVSNRVAKRLRAQGIGVTHVRENGEFSSAVVTRLRETGKDPRNLALEPLPEVLLYLAREAQIAAELIAPALHAPGSDKSVVIADRYFYSYEVLGHHGRGLPRAQVNALVDAAAGDVWPDLVVLLDVDPHLARARRKSSKIVARAEGKPGGSGSRKGLAGASAIRRIRDGYRALAAEDPSRWLVIDNGAVDQALDDSVDRVVAAIVARVGQTSTPNQGGGHPSAPAAPIAAEEAATSSATAAEMASSLEAAGARFFEIAERRAVREPGVAAYWIAGLRDQRAADLRERLVERAPHVVAYGLRELGDERSWQLRERLVSVSPQLVARSLAGIEVEGERAAAMRRLLVDREPTAVLATLRHNDSDEAWELRSRFVDRDLAAVLPSLGGLRDDRAWRLREDYLRGLGGDHALATLSQATPLLSSLAGVDGERSHQLRAGAFDAAPVSVLESLAGTFDEPSWAPRERWVERAPKVVLRSLVGLDHPRAWELRRTMVSTAKEALDGMAGADQDVAWELRETNVDLWPSTAVKSLGALYATERGQALATSALRRSPDDTSLLRHLAALHNGGNQR